MLPLLRRTVAWTAALDPAEPWDEATMRTVCTLVVVSSRLPGTQYCAKIAAMQTLCSEEQFSWYKWILLGKTAP